VALNVKVTPTFIVNGNPLQDFGVEQLKTLVRREVDKVYKQ
jgi:protein-disulfide isomerase